MAVEEKCCRRLGEKDEVSDAVQRPCQHQASEKTVGLAGSSRKRRSFLEGYFSSVAAWVEASVAR